MSNVCINSGTWTLIPLLQSEEKTANLKVRDALLGPQNNEASMNSKRDIFTAMRRKELASIVQKYDKVSRSGFS